MTQEDVETFVKGIPLKDFTCQQPAKLEIVSVDSVKNQKFGSCNHCRRKFHQVKRMVSYCGKEVDLQRLTMGTLALDENLERGEWRRLTKEELEVLLASIA